MHFWDTENPTEHYVREKANSRLYVSQLTKHAKSPVSLKRSSFCQLSMFAVFFVAVTVIYLFFIRYMIYMFVSIPRIYVVS